MNIDDVFVKLSEFNKRVKEVEGISGDVLSAFKYTDNNKTEKQYVNEENEPYILQYPYTTSSAEFAMEVISDKITDDELSNDLIKTIQNLSTEVFKGRVSLLSASTLPPEIYDTVKHTDTLKLFLSTDRSRILMKNFTSGDAGVMIVHLPHAIKEIINKRSMSAHDTFWDTHVVMPDPDNDGLTSYDMGLIEDIDLIKTLCKITNQILDGEKVIAL